MDHIWMLYIRTDEKWSYFLRTNKDGYWDFVQILKNSNEVLSIYMVIATSYEFSRIRTKYFLSIYGDYNFVRSIKEFVPSNFNFTFVD